ncbi:MAG TPA: hypothetical protein VF062_13700 [Candidatus Limnocylindrales bacterium]
MPVVARVIRVVLNAIQGLLGALRWLARQAYRQRALGVAANPQLTRLLDLHFVTVAAHLTLFAVLIVAQPAPAVRDWLLCLPLLALLTAIGIWRGTRPVIGALIGLQLVVCLIAALGVEQPILLTVFFAVAVAQQVTLARNAGASLGRATAAGLLLGILTGGAGLLVGLLTPAFPLWLCAILLTIALVLAFRVPGPPARPKLPAQPRQKPGPPDGYAVYRPSSLDDTPHP